MAAAPCFRRPERRNDHPQKRRGPQRRDGDSGQVADASARLRPSAKPGGRVSRLRLALCSMRRRDTADKASRKARATTVAAAALPMS